MEATQLLLNDQLVTITADAHTIKRLNSNDAYLSDYVNRAAKSGQFHFLFTKDPTLRRIVVKRVSSSFTPVWCKKGRPSETDSAATLLLLKLRNSEKYAPRFSDNNSLKSQLWAEIANEMKMAGFDVDGNKCAQKFLHLTQSYQKKNEDCHDATPEMWVELKKVFGEKGESEEEEWVPKTMKKRKKGEEDEGEFLRKFLKKNCELKDDRFREICKLMKRRNQLFEEKLKQNREVIAILGRLVK